MLRSVESPCVPAGAAASGDEAELWRRWRSQEDAAARAALIELYLPYARMLAAISFQSRHNDEVEFGDYFQLASVGLMEAVDRYDPAHGAQFRTYSSSRIRGAILNGLDRLTEKGQQIALRKRLAKERLLAAEDAAARGAGSAGAHAPAESPARSPQELLAYLAEVGIGLAIGVMLEGSGMIGSEASEEPAHDASPEVLYFRKQERLHWQALLRDLVQRLPEQERCVIRCHYEQEIPFDEIAGMLELSRSRISQLHRQGVARLRAGLSQAPPCDVAW